MDEIIRFTDKTGRKRKGKMVTCQFCGKSFPSRPDQVRKYCSLHCVHMGQRRRVSLTCDWCGKTFERVLNKVSKGKHGYNFCCRACKDSAQGIGGIVAVRPAHYKNGRSAYRRIAFTNYPHQCYNCKWDDEPAILEVHHIDSNRDNNMLDNLVILCPTCHTLRHFHARSGKWGQKI